MQKFIYHSAFFYDQLLKSDSLSIEKTIEAKENNYYSKEVNKKNGLRYLDCLKKDSSLYKIQQNLRKNFLNSISIPDYVYGFVPDNSYKDFLVPHTQNSFFLRLDIKDFFSSISKEMIYEVFTYYFKVSNSLENKKLIEVFSELVSLNEKLPQGGVTSPIVSNIVFRQLDIRIFKYCEELGITYTRYADDLLFSSNHNVISKRFFLKKIAWILSSKGFSLNNSKTKFSELRISLNGFVIEQNESIRLSRKKLRNLSTLLFVLENTKHQNIGNVLGELNKLNIKGFKNPEKLHQYLNGYRAFLIQMIDTNDSKNNEKIKKNISRIEKAVVKFYSIN